uniref:RNA-directed DNA polymerase n=1 Tax=Trichogramma kaykai TaxID=54128 RepID=A0ABD2W5F9_9HYME
MSNDKVAAPAPLTPSEGCNGTQKKESRKMKTADVVSAPLTPSKGRVDAPKVDKMKWDKVRNFPVLPLTSSEGCSNGQWKEDTVASAEGMLKLMHRASEREHERYCQEAKIDKAQLGEIDKIIDTLLLEGPKLDRRESPSVYASFKGGGETCEESSHVSAKVEGAISRVPQRTTPLVQSSPEGEILKFEASDDECAALASENRDYICVQLNGKRYKALYDPGAQSSFIGPKIARKLANRLQGRATAVKGPCSPGVITTLGRLDVQVHINGKTERMQWRAMSYLDHDVILGADFKNLWAVDTQTVEGEWSVHKGPWLPFYREDTNSEADVLVECASLAIASASEQACIKALLDRVLGEHEDSEAETFECAGLSEITPEQEAAIRVVVDRMMTAEPGALGLTRLTEHHIDVQGASPIKHKMRRMSPPMLQVAHDEVKKMLAEGVIEPSASAWSSAPVIVKKADGSNRFCIDYRDLNKVTKKDAYPVQNIDVILDKLRRARYITTIDLKSAYFQIAMEESSKKYTAFAVPGAGLFQFTRLAFGLTNAPMTFQRLIDALFGPECEPYVFGYLDDIVVVTETFEQHLVWLEKVLGRLNDAGLTINRKKCEFCRSSVKYLGYVLDGDGLRVDEDKVAPVMNYPAPTDLKSLRRFLGMLGWYARFIPNDEEMKLPLLKLTKKNAEWIWAEEQQRAFEALKKALTEAPVLARPDFTRPFIVQCDASAFAIGGVLSQVFDDGEHPIVYVSRVLTAAERNYTTSEKECLALLWTIRKLRPYLEGYRFIAVTDHSALQYLRNLKDPTGRLAR